LEAIAQKHQTENEPRILSSHRLLRENGIQNGSFSPSLGATKLRSPASNRLTDNLGKIEIAPDERAKTMIKPLDCLRNLPAPVRMILMRPWFYLAVTLHAIALMLPTHLQRDVKTSQPPEEDVVKITQLPVPGAKTKNATAPAPPTRTRSPQQTLRSTPRRESPVRLAAERSFAPSLDSESQPRENSQPTSGSPEKSPSSRQTSQSSTRDSTSDSTPPPDDFFENFPRYPNAQQGSSGVLRPEFEQGYVFNTSDSLDTVIAKFESELLPPSPFRWENRASESNFRVYQVLRSSDRESKFLHFIVENNTTVLYLESNQYSLEELKNAKTEPMDFFEAASVIGLLGDEIKKDTSNRVEKLQNRNAFEGKDFDFFIPKTDNFSSPENMAASLEKTLTKQDPDYKFAKISDYGGGLLYKITTANSHIYLTFVSTPERELLIAYSQEDPRE
jgi:hypothetical protein